MKKVLLSIGLMIMVGTLVSTAWAQQRAGKGMKQMYSRTYDLNTVETIEGEIVEVSYNPSKKNAAIMGVYVVVKTETETVPVHLGPAWYLNEQEKLNKGDKITVKGSRITYDGAPAIVAETVQRSQMTLRLRDQNGLPVWRGWRMSSRMDNQL